MQHKNKCEDYITHNTR